MGMRNISYQQGMREALTEIMRQDDRVILLGEDIALLGGAFGVTRGMIDEFGEDRVRDTPITENAIIGCAIGASLNGLLPVCEIQFCDLLLCAMDQLCNHAAKYRYMTGGSVSVPIVIRSTYGTRGGTGAQHAQSLHGAFLQYPGLKIVAPSSVSDGKAMLKSAVYDPDPVLFFEHRFLYSLKQDVPEPEEIVPLGKAKVVKAGRDVTLLATGQMVYHCLSAAEKLSSDFGIDAEIVDVRSIVPFDSTTVLESVEKTGRCVIVDEGPLTGGLASEVSAFLMERAFDSLDGPVLRVATDVVPPPYLPQYIAEVVPNPNKVYLAVKGLLGR